MAHGGFGICGHKNNFSTKILCGNWVEDRIGARLASTRPEPTEVITTDTRANFIAPADMDDKQTANCPEINTVEAEASRRGLNYDVMFGHGKATESGGKGEAARFCSVETLMMSTRERSEPLLNAREGQLKAPLFNNLARAKAVQRAREERQRLRTTSQLMQQAGSKSTVTVRSHASDSSFTKEFLGGEFAKRKA